MKNILRAQFDLALRALGLPTGTTVTFEKPRVAEHGDLTTNVAMVLAKTAGRNPRDLANEIVRHLTVDPAVIRRVTVAGPGFINISLTDDFYRRQLSELIHRGGEYGRSTIGAGTRVQVEFVSANPTGPLTVGHGRGAVFGDTVARLLEWTGHDVTREYYFNNAGRQMRILGDSVRLRYLELLGDSVEFPADYYQGEYIRDIARHLVESHGDALRKEPAEGRFKEQAEKEIFDDIKKTLKSIGIQFRSFFNESSLYTDGKIRAVIDDLRSNGLVYDQDGAVWFKTTSFGADKDKVIVKATGEPTYRLPDIAYHRDKFRRGFDLVIDVFGADHIATYPDVLAGLKALGLDETKVRVLIHQFVTITQNGEVVKMSTRKANFITLDELIAEVGPDVVRYFFIVRTISSHLNFDLGLAKQQSDENPVYYLQMAHARISGILRFGGIAADQRVDGAQLGLLVKPEELDLMKSLLDFPDTVESCACSYEPHRLAEYLHNLAGLFHRFYHEHRVITEDSSLSTARLALCFATRVVLRNGFSILGIGAPEQM